jgi:hypothetical protein
MALPVILDCDPGHDDAIALILALASPELKVLAVTTSAGNQTPDKTLNNALRILTLLGRDDIPVAAGAAKPLARELIIADNVHGESGLDGPELPDPAFAPRAMSALELMASVCARARSRSPWCRPGRSPTLPSAGGPPRAQAEDRPHRADGAPPVRATGPRGGIQYLCGSRSGRYGLQVGAAHHHVRAGRDP